MSNGMAKLSEMQTIYGIEDVYDMLEIISIDGFNNRQALKNGNNS